MVHIVVHLVDVPAMLDKGGCNIAHASTIRVVTLKLTWNAAWGICKPSGSGGPTRTATPKPETADFQPVASNDISVSDAPPVEAGYERSPATSHEKSAVVQQGVLRYWERHELAGGTIKLELPD